MKTCVGCKYADWVTTASGRLHPSGYGRCTYVWKAPALPQAFWFLTEPRLSAGYISRREDLADHCVYWSAK
jgi:hypothetical protein